jgi:cell division protein FtsL
MSKKKVKKRPKITKGEKMLYSVLVLALVFSLGIKTFCGASISELKISIEEYNYKIDAEKKNKESLTMKVNELTSFENVKDVVGEMGLAYNNDNIIIINNND